VIHRSADSDSEPAFIVRAEDNPLDTMLTLSELVDRLVTSNVIPNRDTAEEHITHVLDYHHLPRADRYPSLSLANLSVLEALDYGDPKDVAGDARIALAISPDCALAWFLLVEEPSLTLSEKRARYVRTLEAYEQLLDLDSLTEEVLSCDDRQYLRARTGLALCLWDEGRKTEAVSTLWETLRLNPWDYNGVRGILAGWLPQLDDDAQLGQLVREWPVSREDPDPKRTYTETLLYFRLGDYAAARAALDKAYKQNPHVLDAIAYNDEPDDDGPPAVAASSVPYAESANSYIGAGWRHTIGAAAWALRWLQERSAQ